jgi:threonine/homoserine/homoserine lactone efflux protein
MLLSFLRAIVIGFSIAAPVGPIGILCIRRSLSEGWLIGLLTGLGAATADAVYGSIAGFGLTFISTALISHAMILRLVGSLFLCYLGVKTIMTKPVPTNLAEDTAVISSQGQVSAYLSAGVLTLTNPITIMSFAAVFTGLGLTNKAADYGSAAVLVTGIFLGSALWWLSLSSSVSLLRSHFNLRRLEWLNRISGAILLVFGIIALSTI